VYVRVWYNDGCVSDRPASIEWDGAPAAEFVSDCDRSLYAAQVFNDNGRPLTMQWPLSGRLIAKGERLAIRLQLPIISA
jgi:hypothetical protein